MVGIDGIARQSAERERKYMMECGVVASFR